MLTFDYLANHKYLIPMLAQWHLDECGNSCKKSYIEKIENRIAKRTNFDKLDICFICFHDDRAIGTISITDGFVSLSGIKISEDLNGFTPVLATLFVIEEYRRQKVGEKLVEYAKQQAAKFRFRKIYLNTYDKTIHLWYEKLGWKFIQESTIGGFDIKIWGIDL